MKRRHFIKSLYATAAILAVASGSAIIPGESRAATQGSLNSTSTGTVTITVTKPAQVQITGLQDMTVQNWTVTANANEPGDVTGDIALDTTACLYSTGAATATAGAYTLKATGANSTTSYYLQDNNSANTGAAYQIPYTVKWNTSVGAGGTLLTDNTAAPFTGGDTVSASCADGTGTNTQLNIKILATDMAAAGVSTFADTLTLLVAPN